MSGPTPALTIERRGPVLVASMDDGKANALSFDMIAGLRAALAEVERDDGLGALVVAGRDRVFSGGYDLGVMLGGDMSQIITLVADGGELVRSLYGATVPVVAACTGSAVAGGALTLLGCDVRVGADIDCKIGFNEVAIKMVLPDWAFTIADARLSKRHLQRAAANARLTDGVTAVDVGFLDEVVPADQVLERAVEAATTLADTLDPAAYASTVTRLRGDVLATMATQIESDRAAA